MANSALLPPPPAGRIDVSHDAVVPAATRATRRPASHRILIVDDQPDIRRLCRLSLKPEGLACGEASSGPEAIAAAAKQPYDLVLLDVDLPGFNGEEVLRRLRKAPPCPNLKIVMFSGAAGGDELSRILLAGADDFLLKPFSTVQLRARVKSALRLKDAQDRSDLLNRKLLTVNAEMEKTLADRDVEIIHARNGLVLALAKLVEHRSKETGPHLMRLQRYCRILAREAAGLPGFASLIDANFIRTLEVVAPLHDIGKAAIPDGVLNKAGPLTADERAVMQTHTTIGADTLREVARRHPFSTGFLQMAIDIAQHHHEKWDGTGYPNRLSGAAIPVAARVLAIGDVYDAMRSPRIYKAGYTHEEAVEHLLEKSPGHFDPALLDAFRRIADRFDRAFGECVE